MDPRKRLSGGYVCERELGRGGQGVVWLARDRTGRQVVVKFLLLGMEYGEVALARVRREFGAASRVGELATARVLDADLSGQHPCIVSEFLQGPTTQQHVAASGQLPSGRLHSLGLAVAHALAQAHRVGVVHRDVKPSNQGEVPARPGRRGEPRGPGPGGGAPAAGRDVDDLLLGR
ncbi:protein kinase [Streptomyces sp. NPDC101455]|uniref:protein kinase domain-containing protein n=1 Tax=Streptomyces sp. NPDC101455 TaxID=3366142 RepID=UPI003803B618